MSKATKDKNNKERVLDVKLNKAALERFMAKLFWYVLIFITIIAFAFWIFSISELYNAWNLVGNTLYEAWMILRVPFITSIICVSFLGLVALFVYLVRKS